MAVFPMPRHVPCIRLQTFLNQKFALSHRNRRRLKARITAPNQHLTSKRLNHPKILLPQSNYSTTGDNPWR